MNQDRDTLFWCIAYILVSKREFEIFYTSTCKSEIWLKKEIEICRLKKENVDSTEWLQQDIAQVYEQWGRTKKISRLDKIRFTNTYLSNGAPTDDYNYKMNRILHTNKLVDTNHMLIDAIKKQNIPSSVTEAYKLSPEEQLLLEELLPLGAEYAEQQLNKAVETNKEEAKHKRKNDGVILPYLLAGKMTFLFVAIMTVMLVLVERQNGSKNVEVILQYGAKYTPLILEGEWWRLFTANFLHISAFYFLPIIASFIFVGCKLEHSLGSKRFAAILVCSGIISMLGSLVMSTGISIGMTGVNVGLVGIFAYIRFKNKRAFEEMDDTFVVVPTLFAIAGTFDQGADLSRKGLLSVHTNPIDYIGVIGQLAGGLIGAFLMLWIVGFPGEKSITVKRVVASIATIMLIGVTGSCGYTTHKEWYNEAKVIDQKKRELYEDKMKRTKQAEQALYDNRFSEAEKILDTLIKEDKLSLEILHMKGFVLYRKGNYKEAKKLFHDIVETNDSYQGSHHNLSLIYLQEGNIAEADKHIKSALKYNKDNKEYQKVQKQIESRKKAF